MSDEDPSVSPEPDKRHGVPRRSKTKAVGKAQQGKAADRGKLKFGDDWNAIRIIALSQSNPLLYQQTLRTTFRAGLCEAWVPLTYGGYSTPLS